VGSGGRRKTGSVLLRSVCQDRGGRARESCECYCCLREKKKKKRLVREGVEDEGDE